MSDSLEGENTLLKQEVREDIQMVGLGGNNVKTCIRPALYNEFRQLVVV